jgi:hypothetical protein
VCEHEAGPTGLPGLEGPMGPDRPEGPPGKGPPPADATLRQAMSHRLRTEEGKALYKRRGATVEPAIGNLKKILDRVSRRGLNATAFSRPRSWSASCTAS